MEKISSLLDSFFLSSPISLDNTLKENRLERMRILLSYFDNPENSFISIHVAGSKGKGSVCKISSDILTLSGYSVGLYLSPHVYDVRERFTLDGKFFEDKLYLDTLREIKEKLTSFLFQEELGPSSPTTFELYTLYGYLLFKNAHVDVALIETGMGGRLDATNTINSKVSVITKIEKEHTKYLGNTLREIAREKAGIIRSNTPTILLKQNKSVVDEISTIAKEKNSELIVVDSKNKNDEINAKYNNKLYSLSLSPNKECDILNSRLALYVCLYSGLLNKKDNITFKINSIDLPSRYEKNTWRGIDIIFDGAHTVLSVKETLKAFLRDYGKSENVLVFSCAEDKNETKMEKLLFPHFSAIITTTLGKYKKSHKLLSSSPSRWQRQDVSFIKDPNTVLNEIEKKINNGLKINAILVIGSFYLPSFIKEAIND